MLKDKQLFLGVLFGIFLCGVFNVTPVFAKDIDIENERLSGNNRYTTSAAISKAGWAQANTVIIASGKGYADALAASSLSKSKDAPILLTQKSAMSLDIVAEIKRLKATRAILVGGTTVIGDGVQNQLKDLNISIDQIGGTDRYDTSKKVAESMDVKNGIIMATGLDFADALSIAPVAAIKSIPILLSPKDSMTSNISEFIKSKTIPVSYIVGGTNAISKSIVASLPKSNRLGGDNRYATNLIINKNFENDLNFDTIYLATGSDFPDALAGSDLAAKNNAPIFLTGKDSISSEAIDFIKSKNVKKVVVLGGNSVISDNVINNFKDFISDNTVITGKFTDPKFKTKVYSLINKASPSPILYSDVKNIKDLNLNSLHITNLSGIEYFSGMTDLSCSGNQLKTLDLSKNLALSHLVFSGNDKMANLDISKNTALTYLYCSNTQLKALDVSKNVALTYLSCENSKLTNLDVSKNIALTDLFCSANKLNTLDVSKNTELITLFCDGDDLKALDVSKNKVLTALNCSGDKLTTLEVSNNKALTVLYCADNKLTTLDVSKNTALNDLYCSYNELKSLYSIRDGGTWEYKPQYTDSTHKTRTNTLKIDRQ